MGFEFTELQKIYFEFKNSKDKFNSFMHLEFNSKNIDIEKLANVVSCFIEEQCMLNIDVSSNFTFSSRTNPPRFKINYFDSEGYEEACMNIERFIETSVNVKNGYLFDIAVCLDPDSPKLTAVFSMLITDIQTQKKIFNEIEKKYYWGLSNGINNEYDDWLEVQKVYEKLQSKRESANYSKSVEYWKGINFIDSPIINNVSDFSGNKKGMKVLKKTISKFDLNNMLKYCKSNKVSFGILIYSLYAQSLFEYSRNDKFSLWAVFDKRIIYGIPQNVIGNFSDVLPIEFDFSEDIDFALFLKSIQNQFWKRISNSSSSGLNIISASNVNQYLFTMRVNSDFVLEHEEVLGNEGVFFEMKNVCFANVCIDLQLYKAKGGMEVYLYYHDGNSNDDTIRKIFSGFTESLVKPMFMS